MSSPIDFYTITDDSQRASGGAAWASQLFTASKDYDINSIKLKLYRTGTPGNFTVSIRATANYRPTGADIGGVTGVINGNDITDSSPGEWYEITFDSPISLTNGIKYAIVWRAVGNSVNVRNDNTGDYVDGRYCYSNDSGVNWGFVAAKDFVFETYAGEFLLLGSVTEVSDVSGVLSKQIEIQGSTTETSNVSGVLNSIPLAGSIDVTSGVLGEIDLQSEFISSIIETSNISGVFKLSVGFKGSVVEISNISGILNPLLGCSGSITGVLNVKALMDGMPLAGISNVISSISGVIDRTPILISSLIAESSISGYLTIIPDFNATTLFWRPENNIVETLEWKTSILKAHNGDEQRIKIRQTPRQYFRLQLMLDLESDNDKINTWFDSIIHTWQKKTWLLPIWVEYVEHSADISIKDDIINVDTTFADFRNNSKAIVWKSSTEYEVITIDTKTDSQLNLSYSMLNSFTGHKYIIPVRTANMISSSKKEKTNSQVTSIDLIFAVYDNIEITDYTFDTNYDGYEVLDIPAFMDDIHLESSDGDILITDFETGIFKVESHSTFNILTQNHNFFNDTKAECWNFRKFLHSLNGRQKTILIPTFRDDVIQTDNIEALDTSVNIENIKLAENMAFNSLRTYIGFYFPLTNTLIIRKITAITELDSNEEQITFNSNLGLGSDIIKGDCRICFVDRCRLASDRIQIHWPYAHRNECRTDFVRVS